ncbi:radical SAM protein [Microbacterium soli]|uniref:GRRM system radical SAM/SPASM domain protein n=1 Tax=Microbacterium soli TaxID=446075 RepID=A0ABP7NDQ7_9MICO
MQPGTGCNLDCLYCYLPEHRDMRRMPLAVARATAETVNAWAQDRPGFEVFWHGGEPLAVGRRHFTDLLAPFSGVRHGVQTNATLINDAWCDVFAAYAIRVGVSIDGPPALSAARRTRSGQPAYGRIMRGIDCLRRNGISFTTIAVVSEPDPELAAEFYEFFVGLGTEALGVSIEQRVGANTRVGTGDPRRAQEFWIALTEAWMADPAIRIREIDRSLRHVRRALAGEQPAITDVDPLPTITCDGDVVLVAPELAGFHDPLGYGDFDSGNVLADPLHEILAEAGDRTTWLADHLAAVDACRGCASAQFCDGPSPADAYFERGRIDPGPTDHCRTTTMTLADTLCRPLLAAASSRITSI